MSLGGLTWVCSNFWIAVGAEGELVRGPTFPDQIIRIRNVRISGKPPQHVSQIANNLKNI